MDTQKIIKILENIDLVLDKLEPIFKKVLGGSFMLAMCITFFYIIYSAKKAIKEMQNL